MLSEEFLIGLFHLFLCPVVQIQPAALFLYMNFGKWMVKWPEKHDSSTFSHYLEFKADS